MKNIMALSDGELSEDARILLARVREKFGRIPNLLRCMAHSPNVLKAYLDFAENLEQSSLSKELREQLALAVANANDCEYCLSAHVAVGELLGIPRFEIAENMRGSSHDRKTARALHFAVEVVRNQGQVSDSALEGLRSAEFSEQQIAEIISVVSFNLFTNYFNHIAKPTMDYPAVDIGIHDMKMETAY